MIAPLGVAAAPFLGNRIPIGAGFLLERRARFEILLQRRRYSAIACGEAICAIASDVVAGHARFPGGRRRRGQQQREREISGA